MTSPSKRQCGGKNNEIVSVVFSLKPSCGPTGTGEPLTIRLSGCIHHLIGAIN